MDNGFKHEIVVKIRESKTTKSQFTIYLPFLRCIYNTFDILNHVIYNILIKEKASSLKDCYRKGKLKWENLKVQQQSV